MSLPGCVHRRCTERGALRRRLRPVLYVSLIHHPSRLQLLTPRTCADNNYCGLDQPSDYNFATWDNWAKTVSSNKAVKVYIGAPGSADAAGEGYVGVSTLANYVSDAQKKWSSFGGVMLWDADTAYSESRSAPLRVGGPGFDTSHGEQRTAGSTRVSRRIW